MTDVTSACNTKKRIKAYRGAGRTEVSDNIHPFCLVCCAVYTSEYLGVGYGDNWQ